MTRRTAAERRRAATGLRIRRPPCGTGGVAGTSRAAESPLTSSTMRYREQKFVTHSEAGDQMIIKVAALGMAACAVALLSACSPGTSGAAPEATVTVTAGASQPAPAALTSPAGSAAGAVMTADGVYVVGQDIQTGKYHTAGESHGGPESDNCYYALLRSTNTNSIIDNNNISGPATINVSGRVKAVQIQGCKPWTRI